jgi:hypothetical protein
MNNKLKIIWKEVIVAVQFAWRDWVKTKKYRDQVLLNIIRALYHRKPLLARKPK